MITKKTENKIKWLLIFVLIISVQVAFAKGPKISTGIADTSKIDDKAVDGLSGVTGSLAYNVQEIAKHFHNRSRVFGKSANQTGTDWSLEDSLTTFQAISGDGAYGADADDEAKIWGTGDATPVTGDVKFDMHRILVVELSVDSPYILRLVWGAGTMADAITAEQYSTFLVQYIVAGSKANGSEIVMMLPKLTYGVDKVWLQVKCATNNATADVLIKLHGYEG